MSGNNQLGAPMNENQAQPDMTAIPPPSNDLQNILGYLQSPQGHEITSRLLTVIEDVKKSTLEKHSSHAAFEKWLQAGVILVVVIAASVLACLGKFDTSLGVLFGSLVGYIFGKK